MYKYPICSVKTSYRKRRQMQKTGKINKMSQNSLQKKNYDDTNYRKMDICQKLFL